jgi:hypothetical protein
MSQPSEIYFIQGQAPFSFVPANKGRRVSYGVQPNSFNANIDSDFHPTPRFVGADQYTFAQPLIFQNFDFATENFQLEDFNAALIPTAIDSPSLGLDSTSASSSYSLPAENGLNQWDFPVGMIRMSNGPAEGGYFMNGSAITGNFRPFNRGSFLYNDFRLSFSSTLDTSTEEIFQQGVGWNINPPLFQRNDGNIIWDPPFSTTSIAQQNPSPNPSLAINISGPLPPTAPISPPHRPNTRFPCTYPSCTKTFKRDYERIRHEASLHRTNRRQHLCHILGCSKSQGKGYSRPDKVTEHLWKKHADLGYTKA